MPTSLRSKIVLVFVLLLLVVTGGVMTLVSTETGATFREHNFRELEVAERVLRRVLSENQSRLAESAALLAADFAFRAAVSAGDQPTMSAALENHGARLGADIGLLLDLDGGVRAHTLPAATTLADRPMAALLRVAQLHGDATGLARINGRLYQFAVVPVLAPDAVGWVAIGFAVNHALAYSLQALSSVEISFIDRDEQEALSVIASTRGQDQQTDLLSALRASLTANNGVPSSALTVDEFDTRVVTLATLSDSAVLVAIQRSEASATDIFAPLLRRLGLMTAAGLGLCMLGGMVMAKRITEPLARLAELAQGIRDGDYSTPIATADGGEIGAFSHAFEHMRAAIATREAEILRLAFEDSLTRLPNRASLLRELEQRCALAEPFALMLLDLERFRMINSALGHDAGDELLLIVANRLRSMVKEKDVVARIGSNVFAVILPVADAGFLSGVADRLQDALSQRIVVREQEIDVSAAIGAVHFPAHGADGAVLLRRADIALFEAKRGHHHFCSYAPSLDDHRRESLNLLSDLKRATEQGQLRLVYQPKVALRDGVIASAEALVRWEHPERGMIPPADFLPFAEQTGAIRLITRWVIEEALRQVQRWQREGRTVQVSVNISARDLADEALVTHVATCLMSATLGPAALCIEITESAMMEDTAVAHATIERLRQLGVAISIDDYGTGYSSLAYIKDLGASELKIDRAFVKDLDRREEDAAIVRSTIELGHNLGLRVVAEGVETLAQLQRLSAFGCDYAQGYLLSRPVPAAEFSAWAASFHLPPMAPPELLPLTFPGRSSA